MESKELIWISVVIIVPILVLLAALATTFVCVIQKRKRSLRSLHHDLTTAAKDDHPIYKEVSPIEILRWYAEAVRLGEITADEGPHQYEVVDLPYSAPSNATEQESERLPTRTNEIVSASDQRD